MANRESRFNCGWRHLPCELQRRSRGCTKCQFILDLKQARRWGYRTTVLLLCSPLRRDWHKADRRHLCRSPLWPARDTGEQIRVASCAKAKARKAERMVAKVVRPERRRERALGRQKSHVYFHSAPV